MRRILGPDGRPAMVAFYEAARPSPARSTISAPIQSAIRDIGRETRRALIVVGEYLHKNNPLYHACVEKLVTFVVGCGLTPNAASSDEDWNARCNAIVGEWWKRPDLQTRNSMRTLQQIIYRSRINHGDIFTLKTYSPRTGRPRIQLVEGFTVRDKGVLARPDQPDGVELDRTGRPQGYWYTPDDGKAWYRLPAESTVLHYAPTRAQQYRGVPMYHAAMNTNRDLDDILALESQAVKYLSSKTDVIKRAGGAYDPEVLARDGAAVITLDGGDGYERIKAAGGLILNPGDEYEQIMADRPSPAWQGFVKFLVEVFCLVGKVPEPILFGRKVGGADSRGVFAAAARVFAQEQQKLAEELQEIWEYIVQWEIDQGNLAPAPDDWRNCDWQATKSITLDAGREAQQDREDVRAGLMTLQEYCGVWGMDWRQHLRQIEREAQTVARLKLPDSAREGFYLNRLYASANTEAVPTQELQPAEGFPEEE